MGANLSSGGKKLLFVDMNYIIGKPIYIKLTSDGRYLTLNGGREGHHVALLARTNAALTNEDRWYIDNTYTIRSVADSNICLKYNDRSTENGENPIEIVSHRNQTGIDINKCRWIVDYNGGNLRICSMWDNEMVITNHGSNPRTKIVSSGNKDQIWNITEVYTLSIPTKNTIPPDNYSKIHSGYIDRPYTSVKNEIEINHDSSTSSVKIDISSLPEIYNNYLFNDATRESNNVNGVTNFSATFEPLSYETNWAGNLSFEGSFTRNPYPNYINYLLKLMPDNILLKILLEFISDSNLLTYYYLPDNLQKVNNIPIIDMKSFITSKTGALVGWNVNRNFGFNSFDKYFDAINKFINYVIENDVVVVDTQLQKLFENIFIQSDSLHPHAVGTLVLPSLINWISSKTNPSNHAMTYVGYIPKGSEIYPFDLDIPWKNTTKWVKTPGTSISLNKDLVSLRAITRFPNEDAMISSDKIRLVNYPLSPEKFKFDGIAVGVGDGTMNLRPQGGRTTDIWSESNTKDIYDEYAINNGGIQKPGENISISGTAIESVMNIEIRLSDILELYSHLIPGNTDEMDHVTKYACRKETRYRTKQSTCGLKKVNRKSISTSNINAKRIISDNAAIFDKCESDIKSKLLLLYPQLNHANIEFINFDIEPEIIIQDTKINIKDIRFLVSSSVGNNMLKWIVASTDKVNAGAAKPCCIMYHDKAENSGINVLSYLRIYNNNFNNFNESNMVTLKFRNITYKYDYVVTTTDWISDRGIVSVDNRGSMTEDGKHLVAFLPERSEECLCPYITQYDYYLINTLVYKYWMSFVKTQSITQLFLNEIRLIIISNPGIILFHKISNYFNTIIKNIDKPISYVGLPIGPPMIKLDSTLITDKQFLYAGSTLSRVGFKDSIAIENPLTKPLNYLDKLYLNIWNKCKLDTYDIETLNDVMIIIPIPTMGANIIDITSKQSSFTVLLDEVSVKSIKNDGASVNDALVLTFTDLSALSGYFKGQDFDRISKTRVPIISITPHENTFKVIYDGLSTSKREMYIYSIKNKTSTYVVSIGGNEKSPYIRISYDMEEVHTTPISMQLKNLS